MYESQCSHLRWRVDDEDLCAAEEDRDSINTEEASGNSPAQNKETLEFSVDDSTAADGEAKPPSLNDDIQPSSRIFKIIMNIQTSVMVFLALSWLYNYIMHEK
ncbi:hypothetical protein B0H19DRAFT_1072300 [Mycena capillaripes]|nr:hypothetical protein B0H19DRAFT_1072300 [Mycena capillaripes]